MTKTISVIAALNETSWYEKNSEEVKNLSATARLALKRNMRILNEMASEFRELQQELNQELQNKYSTDQKSIETEIEDAEGHKQPGRKVKDEFIKEYQKDIDESNLKLDELLRDEDEVELYVIDLDAEIERIDAKDLNISDEALDMLSLYESDE